MNMFNISLNIKSTKAKMMAVAANEIRYVNIFNYM